MNRVYIAGVKVTIIDLAMALMTMSEDHVESRLFKAKRSSQLLVDRCTVLLFLIQVRHSVAVFLLNTYRCFLQLLLAVLWHFSQQPNLSDGNCFNECHIVELEVV